MKTVAGDRSRPSPPAPIWTPRPLAGRAAGLLGVMGLLGITALAGCSTPQSGSGYHSDIDHNGQPFDGLFHSDGTGTSASSDANTTGMSHDGSMNR
jgi:hypothetical protein